MPTETHAAFFLVGPTAVGKTAVVHCLAERGGHPVLSTDAMLVYRGMDIGTAKPGRDERSTFSYRGIDLVNPDQDFSVSAYLETVESALREWPPPVVPIATGGTGLYVSGLVYGMEAGPRADRPLREALERQLEQSGIPALQQTLAAMDAAALDRMADPRNPRRLMRAIERLTVGQAPKDSWKNRLPVRLAGLTMPREILAQRIAARVDRMYEEGLLKEVAELLARYPVWSRTAAQAIGYREARAVLAGAMNEADARERTGARTRQLAKRQMTWFRNQFAVEWINVEPGSTLTELADAVQETWDRTGPTPLNF